jgi:hypothetical protein
MGQQVVFNYPMVSPKVPTTLVTPYSYPIGHPSHSFVSKNGRKTVGNRFLTILTSPISYSTHKSVVWANKWCSIIVQYHPILSILYSWLFYNYPMSHHSHSFVSKNGQNGWKQVFDNNYLLNLLFHIQVCSMGQQVIWYHPRCLLHSWLQIVTLWATISTHLWAKMAENGWKQVFDNTYFHDLLFHTQVFFMGRQVVLNYPMVSPKVPTTLITPYSYPMDHYIHSFVTKNVLTLLNNMFLAMITSITSYSAHKIVLCANEQCQIMLRYHPTCP